MRLLIAFAMLILPAGCDCSGNFTASGRDGEGEEAVDPPRDDEAQGDPVPEPFDPDPDGSDPEAADEIVEAETVPDLPPEEETPAGCTGEYAYLHGDLWPMWYNMRVACDPEHKAFWRCERINGAGAAACDEIEAIYGECTAGWGSPWPCLNWGVCAPVEGTVCSVRDAEICDTRTFAYDSPDVWGTYYGWQWGSSTNLHRFTTIHIRDAGGTMIGAFSSCPGSDDAYMDGLENFGIGPDPQGFIQVIRESDPEKYTDRFGAFACIRLPAAQPVTLRASWMNEFCHTCAADYRSQPWTPCWTEDITMTFEAGRHYLWTERGIEIMDGCAGPPPDVAAKLPEAACSTAP
jgi:hypothetical protein